MDRRNFFKALGAVIGGIAVKQAIPLGRVWSFPKNIALANVAPIAQPGDLLVGLRYGDVDTLWPYMGINRGPVYEGAEFAIYNRDGNLSGSRVRVKSINEKWLELETVNDTLIPAGFSIPVPYTRIV